MRFLLLALLAVGLVGCKESRVTEHRQPPAPITKTAVSAKAAAAAKAPKLEGKALHDAGPVGDAKKGKAVYDRVCKACHQADGRGMRGMLAADFVGQPHRLNKPDSVLLNSIANGYKGDKLVMPPQKDAATEQERKDALAYVRSRFHKK